MRRLLLMLPTVAVAALAASTQTGVYTTSYVEILPCDAGSCYGAAPTSTATGASLAWVDGFALRVCAPPTTNFIDAGSQAYTILDGGVMAAFLCDAVKQQCHRNTQLDQPVSGNGFQCTDFAEFKRGYISEVGDTVEFIPSGVVLNSYLFQADAGLSIEIQTHREHR